MITFAKRRDRVFAEMHDWVTSSENQAFHRGKRLEAITRILEAGPVSDRDKAVVGSHLGILSNWHLISGAVRIINNDLAGWKELAYGMWIDYAHLRLLVEQWDKDQRRRKQPRVELSRASLCLAMAIAFADSAITDWVGGRLLSSIDDGAFGDWGEAQLPWLVLSLFQRLNGCIECRSDTEGGPYAMLLSHWDREERMPEAFLIACDYHAEQSVDQGDEVIGEFARYPFNVIPCEVFAVTRVRTKEGKGIPSIQHPLVAEPFGNMPPQDVAVSEEPFALSVKGLFEGPH